MAKSLSQVMNELHSDPATAKATAIDMLLTQSLEIRQLKDMVRDLTIQVSDLHLALGSPVRRVPGRCPVHLDDGN